MRDKTARIVVWTLGSCSLLFGVAAGQPVDPLRQLGLTQSSAQGLVWTSLQGGYPAFPSRDALKRVPAGDRVAIVRWAGELAKAFTRSPRFEGLYAEHRESRKPRPPEAPTSMDEQLQTQKAELQSSIREMEASLGSMPADQRQSMKEVLDTLRQQVKELDDPRNPLLSPEMREIQAQANAAELKAHGERVAQWEKDYPPRAASLVEKRLREFLDASREVDFTAQLVPGPGGKMVFARADYERKPSSWKLCYRAGRETVEAARAVASQWLEELASAR